MQVAPRIMWPSRGGGGGIVALIFSPLVSPQSPAGKSVYYYQSLPILLVIYVEDVKMAGPTENRPIVSEMTRQAVNMEPPASFRLVLGCRSKVGSRAVPDPGEVRTISYSIAAYSKNIEKYLGVLPAGSSLNTRRLHAYRSQTGTTCPIRSNRLAFLAIAHCAATKRSSSVKADGARV